MCTLEEIVPRGRYFDAHERRFALADRRSPCIDPVDDALERSGLDVAIQVDWSGFQRLGNEMTVTRTLAGRKLWPVVAARLC